MTSPNLHVSLQDEREEYVTLQLPAFYQIASVLVICWCSWSVYLVLVVVHVPFDVPFSMTVKLVFISCSGGTPQTLETVYFVVHKISHLYKKQVCICESSYSFAVLSSFDQ